MKRHFPLYVFGLVLLGLNLWGVLSGLRIWREHLSGRFPDPVLVSTPEASRPLGSREALRWSWDQPVVADAVVGQPVAESPASIDPLVSGDFTWVNDRTLEFQPEDPWPPARPVRVSLDTVLTNRQHRVYAAVHHTTLSGPALDLHTVEPTVRWDTRELQVRLQLNQLVDPDMLRKHLVLMNSDMDVVDTHLRETPQPDEFLLTAPWKTRKGMTLLVKEGLPSIYGNSGALDRDRVYTIHPPQRFHYMGMETDMPTFGQGSIELGFSSPPDLKRVADFLQIEPAVSFSVDKGKWWRRNHCRIIGDFEPDVQYTLHLTKGIQGINGEPLDTGSRKTVTFPARKPGVKFTHTGWVLNASGAQQVQLDTVNEQELSFRLDRVHANNLVAYALRASGKDGWSSKNQPDRKLSATAVWKDQMTVDQSGPVRVELAEPLRTLGQGVYRLTVRGRTSGSTVDRLIAVSEVGLMARQHGDTFLVWAVKLESAEPAANLPVTLWSDTRQELASGQTDENGLVRLSLSVDKSLGRPYVVLAGDDQRTGLLTLDRSSSFPGKGGERPYLKEGYEAFVYTERGIYRPGEPVNARTIVRGPGFALPGEFPVRWSLKTLQGLEVWSAVQSLSAVGTSSVRIPLNEAWSSGTYQLAVALPGENARTLGATSVKMESFVPPQVVVEADVPEGTDSVPAEFRVKVRARMLYGGPAAQHKGSAVMTLTPETFRSSEHPGYSFSDLRKSPFGAWSKKIHSFTTNDQGEETLPIRIPEDKQGPSAVRAVIGLTVKEFSGRAATTFISRRVDRVPHYVGVKEAGQDEDSVMLSLVAVKPDGKFVDHHPEVKVEWFRLTWQSGYRRNPNGSYTYRSEEIAVSEGTRNVVLHDGKASLNLDLPERGVYRIAAEDPQAESSSTLRVYRGGASGAPEREDRLVLTLDREQYAAGDEAVLTIQSPFAGRVLVSLEHSDLLLTEQIDLRQANGSYRFTVPETHAPNLWVRAMVVRPQPDKGALPVLRAEGAVALRLDTSSRHQPLRLDVAEHVMPSKHVRITLTGEPGAEVVVAGVDNGILMLTDFETPDPGAWFRALRRVVSVGWDGFDDLLPELGVNRFAGDVRMGGGGAAGLRQRLNPVDAKRFRPLSWWSGAQSLPQDGILHLEMPMPEFSGELRWMAVQVSGQGVGHADAVSRVGRPVIVQSSLPLVLAPGDTSEWTVRVHNRDEDVREVTLSPALSGPLSSLDREVTLRLTPGEVRVHAFRVKAEMETGKAVATLQVNADPDSWEEQIELAVRPVEAFQVTSRTRILGPGENWRIQPVEGYMASTVRRQVQAASMPALQLGSAIDYLLQYPYGCLEQTVSAATPALIFPEWDTDTEGGSKVVVDAAIQALWKKQRSDGSFGYWHRKDRTSVPASLGALAFLLEAKAKGYTVHEASLDAGVKWADEWLKGQVWATGGVQLSRNIPHACKVLAMADRLDNGWIQRLREHRKHMSAGARIQSAEAMTLTGHRPLAVEMLQGLTVVGKDGSGWYSRTSENADLLSLLLELEPQDGRIRDLVTTVLSTRNSQGRWRHSYENASVLRAMVAYASRYGGEAETVEAGVSLAGGPEVVLSNGQQIPLTVDAEGVLVNNGKVPVYVEERVEGIPLVPQPVQNAFTLQRTLLRMTGAPVREGEEVKSGEPLLLKIEVSHLPQAKDYMVLDQRLPAGLEPLRASLQKGVTQRLQFTPPLSISEPRHLEVRDDRVILFPHRLSSMRSSFLIAVRAVSPGDFRFPAVFGQDMYDEAFRSRGVETRIRVVQ